MEVRIAESWRKILQEEFDKPYFSGIVSTIKREQQAGETIYPAGRLIFNAFDQTPLERVKCVILGQDPYHGPGQAHGL